MYQVYGFREMKAIFQVVNSLERSELPWNAKHGNTVASKDNFYNCVVAKSEFEGNQSDKNHLVNKVKDWVMSPDEVKTPSFANVIYTKVIEKYKSLDTAAEIQMADQSTLAEDEKVDPINYREILRAFSFPDASTVSDEDVISLCTDLSEIFEEQHRDAKIISGGKVDEGDETPFQKKARLEKKLLLIYIEINVQQTLQHQREEKERLPKKLITLVNVVRIKVSTLMHKYKAVMRVNPELANRNSVAKQKNRRKMQGSRRRLISLPNFQIWELPAHLLQKLLRR